MRLENLWARATDIRWDAGAGAITEYRIALSRDGVNFDNVGVVGTDRTTFRLADLTPNTKYWVKVRGRINASDEFSDYSNTVEFTTLQIVSPSNLRLDNLRARATDIRWDAGAGAITEYRIAFSRDGVNFDNAGVVGTDRTTFRLAELIPNTRYWVKVRGRINASDEFSEYSNTVEFTTPHAAPGSPSGLRLADLWARNADVAWGSASGVFSEYRIALSRDGVNFDNAGVTGTDRTSLRLEGLTPNTRYWVKVRANGSGGFSEYSNTIDFTTAQDAPGAPSGLRLGNVWPRTADIAWQPASGAFTEYRIAISRDGANFDNAGVVGAGQASYRLEGLVPNTRYWVKVRANGSGGFSEYSNTIDFTTAQDAPGAPSGLRLANVWPRTADIAWQPASGAFTEYRIAISRDGANFDNAGVVGTDRDSFRLEGLTPNTRYWVKVRANGPGGFSEYSNTIDFATINEAPGAPSELRLENLWARAADVRWQPSTGAVTEYRIAISRNGANFDNAGVVGSERTSFRLDGLLANTQYWVKVRASGPAGFSDYSNTVNFVTRR